MASRGHKTKPRVPDAVQGYFIGKPAPILLYSALVGRAGSAPVEPARKAS